MEKGIAPSILSADFGHLARDIQAAEEGGARYIHVDVMDGLFVPNITIGPLIIEAARRATSLPLDTHLMIVEPERYVEAFASAGADIITIHAEASSHIHRILEQIHSLGCKAGLALNPLTPLEYLRDALPYLDLALIMSVNPGFGGQSFIQHSLERLSTLTAWRDEINPACAIEVDGGVTKDNIAMIASSGADIFVVGSAVFNTSDTIQKNIQLLRSLVSK